MRYRTFIIALFACFYSNIATAQITTQTKPQNIAKSTLSQAETTALLGRYHPAIHIGYGSARPVDFEDFYLYHSELKKGRKIIKPAPITASDIKQVENNRDYHSDYLGLHQIMDENAPIDAPIYGRIYEETLPAYPPLNLPARDVLVLKYSVVFTSSGLPMGLTTTQDFFASLAGDLTIWHELDIHGAVQIIIDRKTHTPMILLLAQHNYFRSYIIGHDVMMPEDEHIAICYAVRSNEPYICPDITTSYRTVGNPSALEFVLTGDNKPMVDGGYDLVYAADESQKMQVQVKQFKPDHPFYTARIPMGDIRKLFGIIPTWFRRGAPGANLNAPRNLRNYGKLSKIFYLQDGDAEIARIIKNAFKSWENVDASAALAHNAPRFWGNLKLHY